MIARSSSVLEMLARELPDTLALPCDLTDATSVGEVERRIADLGPVDALVYNAGKGVWGSFAEVSLEDFEASWRINVLGALRLARSIAPGMVARGHGRIVFIGATASRRGGAKTAAFASAKAAQRSLAESMARELGPRGVHVSLVVVDGILDEPLMRAKLADRPDAFFIRTQDVAETIAFLVRQPRSAWTFELDVRPFGERW